MATREEVVRALLSEPEAINDRAFGWVALRREEAERVADSLIRAGVLVVDPEGYDDIAGRIRGL